MEFVSEQVNPHTKGVKLRSNGIRCMLPAGVGGGSLVYNTITLQPSKKDFEKMFDPKIYGSSFSRKMYKTYYPRVAKVLKATGIPDDVLAVEEYAGTRLLRDEAVKAGYPLKESPSERSVFKLPLATDWDVVREEISGVRVRSALNGEVWFGSNSDYKNHLMKPGNYLRKAISSGHATVRPLSEVTRIRWDSKKERYVITVLSLRESDGAVLDTYEVTAKVLFVTAGSVHTTALLVRARDSGDLPDLSPKIGSDWAGNGDGFGIRLLGASANVGQGGPAGYAIFDFDADSSRVSLEDLPVSFAGSYDGRFPANIKGLLTMGRVRGELGKFTYVASEDVVQLDYSSSVAQAPYTRWLSVSAMLNAANPGSSDIWGSLQDTTLITAHPLGGVIYRKSTDSNCRVRGAPGPLYVVDAALVPGWNGGVNPSHTVGSMAEMCMDRIIRKQFGKN